MKPHWLVSLVASSLVGLLVQQSTIVASIAQEPQAIEFNRDIRPILSENCFYCHGPDPQHRQADLRLDDRQAALEASAIIPGNPSDSQLARRINSEDPELLMPPADSNKKLTQDQKALLQRWIAQGANFQTHWAYSPPTRPSINPHTNDALVQI